MQAQDNVGLDLYDPRARRNETLKSLLLATIRGSLTPLTPRELVARVDLLLDAYWTDVTSREVETTLNEIDLEDIETDGYGRYYAVAMARTLDAALADLRIAAECVGELEDLEGSDCEALRNRQVSALFSHRLLSPHEERVLAAQAKDSEGARNALVESNLRLARSIAMAWHRGVTAAFDTDDLLQEACLGLIRAAEKFEPSMGYRFSTYASWWIRQAVARSLADKAETIRRPVHIVDRVNKVRRARRELEARLGRVPSDSEVYEATNLEVSHWSDTSWAENLTCVALDDLDVETEERLGRTMPSLEDEVTMRIVSDEVIHLLAQLDERSRTVLCFRLGLYGLTPLTLDAIGSQLGVTRERVRQIEMQALRQVAELAGVAA